MPIYEYDCPVCGRFEVLQKIGERAIRRCPACANAGRESKVTRCVSPAAFHLKGSGWYKTDYAAKAAGGKSDIPSGEKSVKPDPVTSVKNDCESAKKPAAVEKKKGVQTSAASSH